MEDERAEIDLDHDAFMAKHVEWSQGESDGASDNGRRRSEMKELDKEMGIHPKARSQIRAGLKIQKEGDRKDWLRSMEAAMPMLKVEIFGNGTGELELEIADDPVEF